jgi:metal-responsive CopG/Arc/MetJ family transcriptional regulator
MGTVKTAISLRESLFERVDALAQELDIPRSHIFVIAVEEFLQRHENRKLLEEINEAHEEILAHEEELHRDKMRKLHREMVEGRW